MRVARLAAAASAFVLLAAAQPLLNQGQPIRVPFTCTDDDIHAFGLDCTYETPCPVYLELAGMEISGAKIILTGNLHTATTTMSSILLASDDEGKTWTEPHERIRFSGLDQIQFLDFERGWIAGHVLQAMPRDPFFLLTQDGGKTWRRQPVFAESQVGSIEQFWFDSRTDGLAVVDRMQSTETGARYSVYETKTGGEAWMIREVSSRALKLKRTAGQDASRRIRADAKTGSLVVERRQGERWQALASFLIEVGACRPSPYKLAEPPPEPEVPAQAKPEAAPAPARPRTPPALKKKPPQ